MPKVLIAGPQSFGTAQSLARAFQSLGWGSPTVTWNAVSQQPFVRRLRIRLKLGLDSRLAQQREFNRVMRGQFVPYARREDPDLLLFVKPNWLDSDIISALSRFSAPIVTWATESLDRFAGQISPLHRSKATYLMDGGDVSEERGHWLPLGFDDETFHPADAPKLWDVLFVGNMVRTLYSKRYAFFKLLDNSGLHRNYRMGFIGETPFGFYNRFRWYPGRIRWVSPRLPMKEFARAIASSRVVVNIHQNDGRMPVNPMFFGIPGCRVCQVAEDCEYLGRWLKPGHEYVAVNSANFVGVLTELLRNNSEIERISAAGFAASAKHTYVARVRQILTECGFFEHGGPRREESAWVSGTH